MHYFGISRRSERKHLWFWLSFSGNPSEKLHCGNAVKMPYKATLISRIIWNKFKRNDSVIQIIFIIIWKLLHIQCNLFYIIFSPDLRSNAAYTAWQRIIALFFLVGMFLMYISGSYSTIYFSLKSWYDNNKTSHYRNSQKDKDRAPISARNTEVIEITITVSYLTWNELCLREKFCGLFAKFTLNQTDLKKQGR